MVGQGDQKQLGIEAGFHLPGGSAQGLGEVESAFPRFEDDLDPPASRIDPQGLRSCPDRIGHIGDEHVPVEQGQPLLAGASIAAIPIKPATACRRDRRRDGTSNQANR